MRTIDEVDADLRMVAVVQVGLREFGAVGTTATMDPLLDERLARTVVGKTNSRRALRELSEPDAMIIS